MFQFGFGNFGFNFQGSAAIQDLLNRADLKLEDLLDEEAVSHEVKTQNQKLLDFLLDPENFKKLVTYCISEPEIDDFDFDQKKCYKYPFVCAEVLSSESQNVVNEFFKSKAELDEAERAEAEREKEIEQQYEEAEKAEKAEQQEEKSEKPVEAKEEGSGEKDKTVESNEISDNDEAIKIRKDKEELVYLAQLFSILDGKDLNLTCAGYFSKIANNLFSKKPSELLSYIYKTKRELLDKMVEHIQSKSIAELLARLLTFETPLLAHAEDPAYNDERVRIFKLILKKLEPSCDIEEINNSAYLICEVFGKYNTMHGSHEVLGKILERPVIDSLFETLAKKSSISSCATALVLGNIFAYYILINTTATATALNTEQPTEENKPEEQQQPIHPASSELSSDIPLIAAFLDNLKFIIEYVASPTNPEEVSTQFGTSIVPFGAARLKFLELLIISMKANNKDIYAKLIEYNFFESLLKLIQHYEWNNMLHNQIEKVIGFVLDAGNDDLKAALLDKANLLNFIVDASHEDKFTLKGKHERKVRKGYMGHVVKIANRILESKDPVVEKHTQGNAKWTEYVNGQLAETNTKYQTHLGGKDPRSVPESLGGSNVQLELPVPSIMEKFTKFFLQPKLEQKDLEEEVIDDGDADTLKEKEEKMLHDSIPKDEITILEEKGEVKSDEAASNEDAPPSRGRASFGVKNNTKVGGDGEEEDESNTLWFSDPAPKKAEEEQQEKKEETVVPEKKAESENPDLENEIEPKDEAHKGEEQITSLSHALESHTAMDLLNESEHHHKE